MDEQAHSTDNLEWLEKTFARHLQWITAADSKLAPILAMHTAMLGILATVAHSVTDWTFAAALVAILSVTPLLVGLVMLLFCAFPRMTGAERSLVYFRGITSQSETAFICAVCEMTTDDYFNDLARQCYRTAAIADAKFRWLRRAIIALFVSILPWILAVYQLYERKP